LTLEVEAVIAYLKAQARPREMPKGKTDEDVNNEMVQGVLDAPDDQPYLILRFQDRVDDNIAKERAKVLANAFNPENNKHPRAKEAFESKWIS
jgi:hypothetical protein